MKQRKAVIYILRAALHQLRTNRLESSDKVPNISFNERREIKQLFVVGPSTSILLTIDLRLVKPAIKKNSAWTESLG